MTMKSKRGWSLVVAFHIAGSLVLRPISVVAQVTSPSTDMGLAGGHPLSKSLPRAWLGLTVIFLAGNTADVAIELAAVAPDGRERLVASTRITSPADLAALVKAGAMTFDRVPTEVPLWLRVSIRAKGGDLVCTYARSYLLHYPDRTRIAALGVMRAVDESAYLGDFTVDQVDADVTRRVSGERRTNGPRQN